MIKSYDNWLNESHPASAAAVEQLTDKNSLDEFQMYIIDNFVKGTWKINSEGLIDIEGSFSSHYEIGTSAPKFSKLARYIDDNNLPPFAGLKFGHVTGSFDISGSKIDSLKGVVKSVKDFDCNSNSLTTLDGAPTATKSFTCNYNNLTSLKGAPTGKLDWFECQGNKLETIEHGPEEVKGTYRCNNNLVKTLKGGPEWVGSFYCQNNQLESLEGGPEIIDTGAIFNHGGQYNCEHNKLKNLKGSTSYCVTFNCSNNDLDSLEGSPQGMDSKDASVSAAASHFTCNNCNLTSLKGGPPTVFYLHCKDNKLVSLEGIYAIDINAQGNILSTATMKLIDRHMHKTGKSWIETVEELDEQIPDSDWNKIPSEIKDKLKKGRRLGRKFGI